MTSVLGRVRVVDGGVWFCEVVEVLFAGASILSLLISILEDAV